MIRGNQRNSAHNLAEPLLIGIPGETPMIESYRYEIKASREIGVRALHNSTDDCLDSSNYYHPEH